MIKSFSELYFDKIHGKLVLLENDRKNGLKLFIVLSFIGSIIFLKFIIKLINYQSGAFVIPVVALILFLSGAHWLSFYNYKKKYKERILKIVFDAYLENGFFNTKKFLSENDYLESHLFQGTYNKYKGEDYAEGDFLGHRVKMSEIYVAYEQNTSKSKERRIIFNGLLVVCELNHNFRAVTVVEHDQVGSVLGKFFGRLFNKHSKPLVFDTVRLESSAFEKKFHVTSEDQIEARKVLTPFMQEHLLKVANKVKIPMGFSVNQNKIHIALSTDKNFFEPPYFKTCVDSKSLRDVDIIFRMIKDIKEEFEKL